MLRRPQLQLCQHLLLSALLKTLEEETGRLGEILQIPDPDCDVLSYFSVKSTNMSVSVSGSLAGDDSQGWFVQH